MYQPITYSLLVEKKACKSQLDLFEKHFGKVKAIPLTKAIAAKFGSLFNITWAAYNLLTSEDYAKYNSVIIIAGTEYDKVTVHAYVEYNKILALYSDAMVDYMQSFDPVAWTEYEKVYEHALAEYQKVTAPARKEYEKIKTLAFVEIYKKGLK